MKQPDKRTPFLFITLGIVTILLLLIDMATGDTYIPITKVWAVLTGGECDEMTRNILLSIRFIRVVVAALIGIALSVSGLQMQIVFQNPLADPYLLGVSSGAVHTRCSITWMGGVSNSSVAGYRWLGLGRNCRNLIGSSHYQPESKKHSRCIDYGSYDRLRSRCYHSDTPIPKFCRTTENVHTLVNGIS